MKPRIESRSQILISGCYRSGTEYFSLLLSNHPDLAVTMYTTSFMRYSYDRYNPINLKKNYTALLNEAEKRIKLRWNKKLNIKDIILVCDKEKNVSYDKLYDLMMTSLFLNKNKKIWAEKIQLVWRQIPNFLEMYPNGKAINIIRDPRSVLASFKKHTYNPEPAYIGAVFNCYDSMQKSMIYQKKYKKKFLLIKYEDLVLNPKKILKKTFKFLDINEDNISLDQSKWIDSYGKKWKYNSEFMSNDMEFNTEKSIHRWKGNLSNSEIALCEYINKNLMKKYGYELHQRNVEKKEIVNLFKKNNKIIKYYDNWLLKKEGIQEFPNDPLDSSNWEENN